MIRQLLQLHSWSPAPLLMMTESFKIRSELNCIASAIGLLLCWDLDIELIIAAVGMF
jgi:hypothetical protein